MIDPQKYSAHHRTIVEGPGIVSPDEYEFVAAHFPIVCVDAIPVDLSDPGDPKIGLIIRGTGLESGRPSLIGGRIKKDESISEAIGRHLLHSLGSDAYTFHTENSEGQPISVSQYRHAASRKDTYDPSKHAIAMNYMVHIPEPCLVKDEASDFKWHTPAELPASMAYNQHLVLRGVVARLLYNLSRY